MVRFRVYIFCGTAGIVVGGCCCCCGGGGGGVVVEVRKHRVIYYINESMVTIQTSTSIHQHCPGGSTSPKMKMQPQRDAFSCSS